MWRPLLALIFSLAAFPLCGQHYFFKQFSVAEGLAQSTVYKVIQDRQEAYWLGTQAGVSRFTGSEFENFSSGNGLSENGVRALCEDHAGQIWFGHTGGGVSRYRDQRFEVIHALDSLVQSTITAMVEDSSGHLWICSESSGVVVLSNPQAEAGMLDARKYSASDISDRVFGAYLDAEGNLYFIADPNVKVRYRDSTSFQNLVVEGIPSYYATTCMLIDSKGQTWVGKYNGGLYKHDPVSGQSHMFDLIELGLESNWVSTLFEDREGHIWAGTWNGSLARIRPGGEVDLYHPENGLPALNIWSLMQDHEDNLLIGTNAYGLYVFKGEQFLSYSEPDGLIDPQVWSILETSQGHFWFGTNEGISIMRPGKPGMTDFYQLKGDRIRFLKEDRQGTVWIGSRGVFSYNRKGQYTFDPMINNHIVDLEVTAMDIDGENNLWVGTLDGLVYYEIDHKRISRLSQTHGLLGNDISTVYADSRKRIWIGSKGKGVSLAEGDSIRGIAIDFAFTPRCFVEDLDGNIWIGTEGRGVLQFDPESETVMKVFGPEDGLLARLINQLNCDPYNNVYIGTNKGLNVFQRSDAKIYAFTPGSGFVGIETKPNASFLDSQGNLWFGTVDGLSRFSPDPDGMSGKAPRVHLSRMEVNHQEVSPEPEQRFSHKQNSFIFEYHYVTLNPDAVQYQIMLEGVDQGWRDPEAQNRVTYPALRHGKYAFKVKARSSEGVWSKNPLVYTFEIKPPLYLTWYFILSLVVALALAIFTYVKIRERALRKENALLEEKVADRTATVVAQKEELAQKNKDITDSIRYAKRIQWAILPEEPPFADTFVLFKPKDIVSGDFYWFLEVDGKEYLAAVDCTGHGVPGAFMSIIGHNSLNKIVKEYGILKPGEILTRLNQELESTLQQRSDATDVLDGMDLALVAYEPDTRILEYAGAFNPLYLIREGELMELKADKASIGRSSVQKDILYQTQKAEMLPGDSIYLFSDGYADQFGGPQMKKFKYRQLKGTLLNIQGESMQNQGKLLDQIIEEWKGDLQQLDDILVMGRRF